MEIQKSVVEKFLRYVKINTQSDDTITDRYPTTVERLTHLEDIPLIFDNDYRPKPAAFALREVLATAQPRPTGETVTAE